MRTCLSALIVVALASSSSSAQDPVVASAATGQQAGVAKEAKTKVFKPAPLYESQEPIEVTFTTNIGKIRGDKGTEPPWHTATMSYKDTAGGLISVPLKARTRGIWRLRMCDFPPLRLNFTGETSKGTIFNHLDKPKLVSYCQDRDGYERYILEEFQLYRIYQILTPVSHRARLLKLNYTDSGSGKIRAKRFGFIMEEPGALGARLNGKVMEQKGAAGADLDPFQNALFGVFQYMIGNTDFSVAALHNVELLFTDDGNVLPIAYDFDFAGAVNAMYAVPDERLGLPNVRRRLFRGYCGDPATFEKVFALFNEKRPEIYALYRDPIGKLLDDGTVRETLKYFDEFYETINDPRAAKRQIIQACIDRR
ncbi:MAG TPA: hypothetical protein VJ840_08155 [Gemmatimonadaceae bacterium]|nr:hypothetical protein [Gemmatimonadaceae bacterium]